MCVESRSGRRRPQRWWNDGVRELLIGRGLSEREGVLETEMVRMGGFMKRYSTSASVRGIYHPII